jgi:phage shock protein PspC (stress-responsive transcriptional regulator)
MGQPEDYRIDDEGTETKSTSNAAAYTPIKTKKLYRDVESGLVGGVLSGLAYYFGIDKVWLRLLLVGLILFAGTGVLLYIILWIVIPEAKTTSEKLEMQGEPINISNIEKKFREEFGTVSDKLKNTDFDKIGNQFQSGAQKVGNTLNEVLPKSFTIFGKILGVFIVFFTSITLISLLVGIFTLGSMPLFDLPWQKYMDAVNYTDIPMWVAGVLGILVVGIPFFFLFILGLKLLINNLKSIGNTAKYTLLALWLFSIALLIVFGIKQGIEVNESGKTVQKQTLNLNPNDTLYVKFQNSDYFSRDSDNDDDFKFVQDSTTNSELIYSKNIHFRIKHTNDKTCYIQIEKKANGKTFSEAKKRAENIRYTMKIENNNITLNGYFLTEAKNKFRDQEIEIVLYIPEGTFFKTDETVQEFDNSEDEFFNLHYSSDNYTYKMQNNQVKCMNCPDDENEYNDVYNSEDTINEINIKTPDVTINKNGIIIVPDSLNKKKGDLKELKLSKDGLIIKTN